MSKVDEAKIKKRKSPSESTVAVKKSKITAADAEPAKPKAAAKRTASRTIVKSDSKPTSIKTSKPKKHAEEPSDVRNEKPEVVDKADLAAVKPGKVKKTKSTESIVPSENGATKSRKTETSDTKDTAKVSSKVAKKASASEEFGGFSSSDEDDQTAALLAGFESSEDEKDPDGDAGDAVIKVPAIPDSKELRKQLVAAQTTDDEDTPGVIYVGRIPHGFYEHQMRQYFSQFGDITRLRLSRNKLTGRPKHYAFVEFASAAVADIVAKTMDKYLMFGHILQVQRIPAEQVHAKLWKGEGRRFKALPRNKVEGGLLRRGASRETWGKRVGEEERRRSKKAKKLQEMGYEFEMPDVKKVEQVPIQEPKEGLVITAGDEDTPSTKDAPEMEATTSVAEEPANTTTNETTAVKRRKGTKESKKVKKARVST